MSSTAYPTAVRALDATRTSLQATMESMDAKQKTAEETLEGIRALLKRWDDAKARFGDALKAAAHRIADSLSEESIAPPDGPPQGITAHGILAPADGWADPLRVTCCDAIARPTMGSQLPAHEYQDVPDVLAAKVRELASMVRRAHRVVVYTGAGISTSAGIADYATKAGKDSIAVPKIAGARLKGDPFNAGEAIRAQPTYTHHCITACFEAGHFHTWVQQNHDGLAGKAGFPQEHCVPIHGEWHDPSNPVVPMDGKLRSDLVKRLNAAREECDLVIAVGTSLSGVAADGLVSGVAQRAKKESKSEEMEPLTVDDAPLGAGISARPSSAVHPALGAVIINLQQTRLDSVASLRVFADADTVMRSLATELNVQVPSSNPPAGACQARLDGDVWAGLSYDPKDGWRTEVDASDEAERKLNLNLSRGRMVKLTHGNPPLVEGGLEGVIVGKTPDGHYEIDWTNGRRSLLGRWILDAARRGGLERLPVVNVQAR
eukprot:CAMPEP_0115852224 /NCGR_PEP_ID=MMETSP0287-20121206/12886_1 /TAXON_ID=412157 /ORGANISM="Chrysochromulina rotalis, Strain UIO044" /LENGTH=489 /DNA_ID=CAMNT_0003306279 /DNA_START=56 /DNA_END=1525 /DNA_ORIENTATION=+